MMRRPIGPITSLSTILTTGLFTLLFACGGGQNATDTGGEGGQAAKAGSPAPPPPASRAGEDVVVARINGEPVTQLTLDREVEALLQRRFRGQLPPSELERYRAEAEPEALRGLVFKKQMQRYAEANDLVADASETQSRVSRFKGQFPSPEQFESAMAKAGFTMEDLTRDIESEVLMEVSVQHYMEGLPEPATPDMQVYFEENLDKYVQPEHVNVSHILLQVAEDATEASKEAARTQAAELKQRLDQGADFEELAREYSDHPSAQSGGNMGNMPRGRIAPGFERFEETAFSLEPGVVSEPVETRAGYHLIRVSEHVAASTPEMGEVREWVLRDMQINARNDWFEKLVDEAEVERL